MNLTDQTGNLIQLTALQSDITQLSADAIVNPANPMLRNGGGVNGAIHLAAGPELDLACAAIGGLEQGQAVATPGFDLPVNYIIHTPSPIWRGGHFGELATLASCYANSLRLADELSCQSIVLPALSTGLHQFPLNLGIGIAISSVVSYLVSHHTELRVVTFCSLDAETNQTFQLLL